MLQQSVWVAAGGFLGAVCRYVLSRWLNANDPARFPAGTFTVNMIGSFLLGFVSGGTWEQPFPLFAGSGFLGAFTTFSTLKLESFRLGKNGQWGKMAVYLAGSYSLGIMLGFLGYYLAERFM